MQTKNCKSQRAAKFLELSVFKHKAIPGEEVRNTGPHLKLKNVDQKKVQKKERANSLHVDWPQSTLQLNEKKSSTI